MKKYAQFILVATIMSIGLLGITNPGFKQPYRLFDSVEGKLIHNYYVFSVYRQDNSYTVSDNGKYKVYKRFIGIALNFFEISPLKVEQE
jgi:hypothetical protein